MALVGAVVDVGNEKLVGLGSLGVGVSDGKSSTLI